ncbi:hypothetical protein BASA82_000483 [Batrachochytrium salamandrivorans]|nr:hypothetical protein BASA81_003479 [Batrachochytrium salamandrivorans]KAH9262456.1 hypothetical protein BASA82_000483 [Batrachochytrium salamandrivorans]
MESAFSIGILLNSLGDIVLATGVGNSFLEAGAFKNFSSPSKSLVVSMFTASFFIHGVVRLVGSRNLGDRNLRLLTILSYLSESLQALHLISNGAMEGPEAMPFIVAPWIVIAYLTLAYKDKEKKQ